MRFFFAGQGRTRVCGEAYFMYAAAGNPRRTQSSEKKTIYGWTLDRPLKIEFCFVTSNFALKYGLKSQVPASFRIAMYYIYLLAFKFYMQKLYKFIIRNFLCDACNTPYCFEYADLLSDKMPKLSGYRAGKAIHDICAKKSMEL
jgi:hypothetical protein